MLCPACQRVLPATEPAEYTGRRAAMILVHGLCLCTVSERPVQVPVVRPEAAEPVEPAEADTPVAGP